MIKIWSAPIKFEQPDEGLRSHGNTLALSASANGENLLARAEPVRRMTSADTSLKATERDDLSVREVHAGSFARLVYHTDPKSAGADRFRLLRMRLRSLWSTGKLRCLLITSALPQDGKTTIALNLATALAEQHAGRVLLIDADLHRGWVEEQLGLPRDTGLSECLSDSLTSQPALQRVAPLGWYLLSRGKTVSNPTELLQTQNFSALLRTLTPQFDWILVDSPPVLSLTDAVALSQVVDGTLLVAKAGCTPVKAVEDAVSLLGRKHIVGLVLNGIDKQHQPYSKYSTYYQSSPVQEVEADDLLK